MPTVANFELFRDPTITLQLESNPRMRIQADISFVPALDEGILLTWVARCLDSGSVIYRILVNGNEGQGGYTLDAGSWSSMQEVFYTGSIRQGTNDILFEVGGGTASLKISDVVLFYRQNLCLV